MSRTAPSPNGDNGHNPDGTFAKGNPGGPGNPYARRTARLRSVLLDAVSDDDLDAIVRALVDRAKSGDVVAAREIFNRLVGKPGNATDPDRLDADEAELASARDHQQLMAALFGKR